MRKNPKARDEYIAEKKKEARAVRNAILPYVLTGKSLYSKDLIVGRGSPNNLSKDLSKDKRKRNIATALGVKPDKIVFAIGKAGAANPNYVTLWKGSKPRTKVAKALFGSESNIYVITNKTINGQSYALKANVSKISEEHADIIFNALHIIGVGEHGRKSKAWKKYKNTDKVDPNAKYHFE